MKILLINQKSIIMKSVCKKIREAFQMSNSINSNKKMKDMNRFQTMKMIYLKNKKVFSNFKIELY